VALLDRLELTGLQRRRPGEAVAGLGIGLVADVADVPASGAGEPSSAVRRGSATSR
jgi:hypothetical protein